MNLSPRVANSNFKKNCGDSGVHPGEDRVTGVEEEPQWGIMPKRPSSKAAIFTRATDLCGLEKKARSMGRTVNFWKFCCMETLMGKWQKRERI